MREVITISPGRRTIITKTYEKDNEDKCNEFKKVLPTFYKTQLKKLEEKIKTELEKREEQERKQIKSLKEAMERVRDSKVGDGMLWKYYPDNKDDEGNFFMSSMTKELAEKLAKEELYGIYRYDDKYWKILFGIDEMWGGIALWIYRIEIPELQFQE